MKKLVFPLLLIIVFAETKAQVLRPQITDTDISEAASSAQIKTPVSPADSLVGPHSVEAMPEFVGGSRALQAYLKKTIVYPPEARKNNVKGRVVVSFLINKYGKPENIKVIRSLSKECDAEVVRLISGMPDWKPGMLNGEPVGVHYTLPVSFSF